MKVILLIISVELNFITQHLNNMKSKTLGIILILGLANIVNGQENTELDLLKAPVSPASNLLGFAQSEIDKPTDVTDFMLSLQSATNSFTSLQSNYAVDIAPYWLLKNKTNIGDISTVGLGNSTGKNVVKQSLVISLAIKNPDSAANGFSNKSTYAGLGFKFSLFRGEYDAKTKEKLKQISELQKLRIELLDKKAASVYDNLPEEINQLKEKRKAIFKDFDTNDASPDNVALGELLYKKMSKIDSIISKKIDLLFSENKNRDQFEVIDKKIKKVASEFHLARVGLSWEVSGGISTEFRQKSFNNSKIFNAGLWTTAGYTWEKYGALLGIVRYLYNPDSIFAQDNAINLMENVGTFDAGIRYILGSSQSKFNCSFEAIYRSLIIKTNTESSWRLILNADYAIFKNQKLIFSFGKNYDGITTNDNNLIATLGTVFGFGNKR